MRQRETEREREKEMSKKEKDIVCNGKRKRRRGGEMFERKGRR
jgi:hypothetical protein